MELVNSSPDLTELSHSLDLEGKVRFSTKKIVQGNTGLLNKMVTTYLDNYDFVWSNPLGLTPQQVLNGFGVSATELFVKAAALKDLIEGTKPGSIPTEKLLPPTNINFQPDGSVVVA